VWARRGFEEGSGFRTQSFVFRVSVSHLGFRGLGFGFGFRVSGIDFRVQGADFRVQGALQDFRVQGALDFRVQVAFRV